MSELMIHAWLATFTLDAPRELFERTERAAEAESLRRGRIQLDAIHSNPHHVRIGINCTAGQMIHGIVAPFPPSLYVLERAYQSIAFP